MDILDDRAGCAVADWVPQNYGQLKDLRELAAERGATCLFLTDTTILQSTPNRIFKICVSRGGAGESQSLVVPMTVHQTQLSSILLLLTVAEPCAQ